jgi:hypothetical protein
MVAAILIGLVVVLVVAMFARGAFHWPVSEDAAPSRKVASERVPSAAERAPVPRPALPEAVPVNAAPQERPSARAETKVVVTQIKMQKYVEEAYPAWLRAHPGQECPRKLIELNDYMDDKDDKDAWGRPMRMLCGAALPGGPKGIKVTSRGRDGEVSEDDIKFGP